MEYETLQIRLHRTGGETYTVTASAPGGETAAGEFRLPFDARDLKLFVLEVGRTRRGVRSLNSPQMEEAKKFGSTLFDELFRDDIRDVYHSASAGAEGAGKGLRITLQLGQAPELMHVPWEYLCDDGRFLSVSERTPIVRYLDLKKAHKPLPIELPLRIVAMVSSPSDVVELDVEEEKRRLDSALRRLQARGQVEIVWLEDATLSALHHTLEEEEFHVFHYIGHGQFDEREGDGVLLFEDHRGRAELVTGMRLAHMLHDELTLQLAVLNACEGARTDRQDPFAGVAASLVKSGIPSVIAMQFEITDEAAIVFAEGFYSGLARGAPVDAALASARKAIWARSNDVEWGTPVLFMRVHDGRVFDVRPETAPPVEAAEPEAPPLDVRLLAGPEVVAPGYEVSWLLTITNHGTTAVTGITALASDGSTLVEDDELQPGRKSVRRWRTRPQEDVETTVTVRATDSRGNRIVEQVAAHVRVRPRAHRDETPTVPPEPRAKPKPAEETATETLGDVSAGVSSPEETAEESSVETAIGRRARTEAQRAARPPGRQKAAGPGAEVSRMTHDGPVTAVAFSPDGRYVVSGSEDNTARAWEATSGREAARTTHEKRVNAVAFRADGSYVASAANDKTARVWEAKTGREVARMRHSGWFGYVYAVAFSPDGRYVVSAASDKTARVWEAKNGREVARMTHGWLGEVYAVAFSPDGRYVASGANDNTARVWEAKNGQEVARVGHERAAKAIAFSPDGRYVVTGGPDKTARVWRAKDGEEVARMTHEENVTAVAFSPDGRRVASGSSDKTARVWEATNGREIARMTHEETVTAVEFSPDGSYVVSGSDDKTARLWDAANGREVARMTHGDQVKAVAFSPDGAYVVTGGNDRTARVWATGSLDRARRELIEVLRGRTARDGDS